MHVSQKSLYALRAVFELAKRNDQGPIKTVEIAKAQAIPKRFLETILSQLKQGGFVESCRGSNGGYVLTHSPEDLTVAEVIQFIGGPIGPITCLLDKAKVNECPLRTRCIFKGMWKRIHNAISHVFNSTTFSDLVRQERELTTPCITSE